MMIEFETLESLLEMMGKIVEEKLTNYKSDFYKYDVETLKSYSNLDSFDIAWLLRDTGTWIAHDAKYTVMFLNQTPHHVYLVGKRDGKYYLEYYGTYGRI